MLTSKLFLRGLLVVVTALFAFAPSSPASRRFNPANLTTLQTNTGITMPSLPYTFACWFKTTNMTTSMALYSYGASSGDAQFMYFRGATAGDPLAAITFDSGVLLTEARSTGSVNSGVWNHGCAVWNSTTDRRVFLNGAKDTDATSCVPTGMTNHCIGANQGTSTTAYFDGLIAEAAVWNAALTDAEVASLNKGASPLSVRPQALIEYWPLVRTTSETGVRGSTIATIAVTPPAHEDDHPRIYR